MLDAVFGVGVLLLVDKRPGTLSSKGLPVRERVSGPPAGQLAGWLAGWLGDPCGGLILVAEDPEEGRPCGVPDWRMESRVNKANRTLWVGGQVELHEEVHPQDRFGNVY